METATLLVPTLSLPALIGINGERIKDINATSGAMVRFDGNSAGTTTTAYIRGSTEQIQLAIALLKLAVLHTQAAQKNHRPANPLVTMKAQANYDLLMFAHEIYSASFSHQSK